MRRFTIIPGLLLAMMAAAGGGADWPADAAVTLVLDGGVAFTRRQGDAPVSHAVQIELLRRSDRWEKAVWGFADALPGLEHEGRLVRAKASAGAIQFAVRLRVAGLPEHNRFSEFLVGGTIGGEAEYAIELKRDGEGWSGTFEGTLKAAEPGWLTSAVAARRLEPDRPDPLPRLTWLHSGAVRGKARASVGPVPLEASARPSVGPGEHPRLLFRKGDVARLRAKAETPAGRKIVARLRELVDRERNGFGYFLPRAEAYLEAVWAAGHGLLYQLTGDRVHAERARHLAVNGMFAPVARLGNWAYVHKLMGVALAYDLLYDAWDEDFRETVMVFLERNIRHIATFERGASPLGLGDQLLFASDDGEGWHLPCRFPESAADPDFAQFRAAAGLAALALLGDPVPLRKPTPPDEAPLIEPARDYAPWIGVPVLPFTHDRMPRAWLLNGPFLKKGDEDPLAAIGGRALARPVPGTVVESSGVPIEFRRFYPNYTAYRGADHPLTWNFWPRNNMGTLYYSPKYGGYRPAADVMANHVDKLYPPCYYLYTVIENDAPRVVQARPNWGSHSYDTALWVGGRRLRDGDVARLLPGLYPVVVEIYPMAGYAAAGPRLAEYVERDYEEGLAACEAAREAYRAAGEQMPGVARHLAVATRSVRRFLARAIGEKGWGDLEALHALIPFLLAERNVMGVDLAEGTGLKQLVPLVVQQGAHFAPIHHFAVSQGFALAPDEHKPVARWFLDKHGLALERPTDAIVALATHPVGVAARHPRTRFALTGEHPRHGVHTFASDWDDPNGFLAVVERGTSALSGPFAAGHFTLRGLGRAWAPESGKSGTWRDRFLLNLCTVDGAFRHGGARLLHASYRKDGSGVVSMLVDDLREGRFEDRPPRLTLTDEVAPVALLRSVAVDYSGASGVPALIAIVDQITGAAGRGKTWQMHAGRPGAGSITLQGASFSIAPEDTKASLCATFVEPRDAELSLEPSRHGGTVVGGIVQARPRGSRVAIDASLRARLDLHHDAISQWLRNDRRPPGSSDDDALFQDLSREAGFGGNGHGDEPPSPALSRPTTQEATPRKPAPGAAPGEVPFLFFVVLTVQEGPAPEVSVTGSGPEATVAVGNQILRFDGQKILLAR